MSSFLVKKVKFYEKSRDFFVKSKYIEKSYFMYFLVKMILLYYCVIMMSKGFVLNIKLARKAVLC